MTTTKIPEMAPEYRPARNRTGSTIGAFLVLKLRVADGPDAVEVTAADTDVPCGVAAAAIANGSNGDRAIRGRARVVAAGAITAGDRIAPTANGKVQTAASGDVVLGQALDAAAADGDVITAEIDCVAPTSL